MDELTTTRKHKNPLVRTFFNLKFKKAVKLAQLQSDDVILDFGCGENGLKSELKGYNITGYDITPEHSDIDDYTKLKPTKIFALDVLEHMTTFQIRKTIQNFKKMNKSFKLITIIPTENKLSVILRRLIGKPDRAEGHITKLKEIKSILDSELNLIKSKNFFTLSYIALYENENL